MEHFFDILLHSINYSQEQPFLFTNILFWSFFTFVLLGYAIVYKNFRLRALFLLICSVYFYYKTSGLFFILLLISCLVNYLLGFHISKKKNSKLLFLSGIIFNLLVLGYFKYAYFFIESYNQLTQSSIKIINWLAVWNNQVTGSHFDIEQILLPVGISFFTFQAISYLVDVKREKILPERNLLYFSFYLSFFPQLVAGPIVRAETFLPQIRKRFKLSKESMNHAFYMICKGLIKKMIISDFIALNFVDRIFDTPHLYTGLENLLATYGYSLQIYCDFSGYTDIAIGVALLLGFRLPINFNSPYKAQNITEFWHRWHITLSTWLRDYLYIPLGGNRKGKTRTNINLLITMILGGLWHGAHIRFILWGAGHGIALIIQKWWAKLTSRGAKSHNATKALKIFITFHFVTFLWLIFRIDNIESFSIIINQITTNFWPDHTLFFITSQIKVISILIIGYLSHWISESIKERLRGLWISLNTYILVLFLVMVATFLVLFSESEALPFIYFRF